MFFALFHLSLDNDCWILDSGATNHICHSFSQFVDYQPLTDYFVTLPNNLRIQVLGIGFVCLSTDLTLHKVFIFLALPSI